MLNILEILFIQCTKNDYNQSNHFDRTLVLTHYIVTTYKTVKIITQYLSNNCVSFKLPNILYPGEFEYTVTFLEYPFHITALIIHTV